jgi:phosphoribosyl-ATP pyrophosphohydrolase
MNSRKEALTLLADVVDSRRCADPGQSYVARLFTKGDDAILKKIIEEAGEVLMAAKDIRQGAEAQLLINETADLWFHCLVMLSHYGLRPEQVLAELSRREGLSGLEEFALRKAKAREQGE